MAKCKPRKVERKTTLIIMGEHNADGSYDTRIIGTGDLEDQMVLAIYYIADYAVNNGMTKDNLLVAIGNGLDTLIPYLKETMSKEGSE